MCAFPTSSHREDSMQECIKHILPYRQMVAGHESIHVIYRKCNCQGNKFVICLHLSSSSAQLNHVRNSGSSLRSFFSGHHTICLQENPTVLVQRINFYCRFSLKAFAQIETQAVILTCALLFSDLLLLRPLCRASVPD
jgi:hypothetical protein